MQNVDTYRSGYHYVGHAEPASWLLVCLVMRDTQYDTTILFCTGFSMQNAH